MLVFDHPESSGAETSIVLYGPHGISSVRVAGCHQCHRLNHSEVYNLHFRIKTNRAEIRLGDLQVRVQTHSAHGLL